MNHFKKNGKSNKGFYVALGVCLIAVGAAAWTTYDSVSHYSAPQKTQSEAARTNNTVSGIFASEPSHSAAPASSAKPAPAKPASSAPAVSVKETAAKAQTYVRPVSGKILQQFSKKPVFSKTLGDYRAHTGVDLSAQKNETVKAVADGVVAKVSNNDQYGNTVVVQHGSIETWYCGLNKMSVKEKQTVKQGTQLGTIGVDPMENDEGPHLHLIMKQSGQYVDPMSILK